MSCLTEERFVEMLDGAGLEGATSREQEHLESCDACQDAWASAAAAAEVLGETRPRTSRRLGLAFPVLAAAGLLLAIVGIVVLRPGGPQGRPPAVEDLVKDLVGGNEERSRAAREALSRRGPDLLPALLACRPRHREAAGLRALHDLMFSFKKLRHADDPAKLDILNTLESMKLDIRINETQMNDVIAFVTDFSKLNVVLDPGLPEADRTRKIDVHLKDAPLREILDLICTVGELDFDLRYGVVWVSSSRRLWLDPGGDASGVLPLNNHWADQLLLGADKEAADKLRSIRVTVDLQHVNLGAVVVYLREISGLKLELDPDLADRLISLRVTDVRMEHVLELATIPHGLDVRIREGAVRLAKR